VLRFNEVFLYKSKADSSGVVLAATLSGLKIVNTGVTIKWFSSSLDLFGAIDTSYTLGHCRWSL